jgi:drug/metabolite transporter (DMT)-like permease
MPNAIGGISSSRVAVFPCLLSFTHVCTDGKHGLRASRLYTTHMSKTGKQPSGEATAPTTFLVSAGIWFAILCWGGAYVAARFLLHPEAAGSLMLSPIMLATLRFGIASIFFLFPIIQAIRHRSVSGRALLLMALLGQLTFTLYYWLQYIGIQETNAGVSAILGVGLIPLFTTLLAPLFGEERFNVLLFTLLLLGFCGVALIVLQTPLAVTVRSGFLLGAGCLIANTFFFAIYNNLSKRWMQDISPIVLTAGTMISGSLGLLLLSLFDRPVQWGEVGRLQLGQWLAILFLSLFCSVLAYFAYNVALSKMDASRVAVYFYFEPLVSIVLGVLLLGEQLSWQTVVGALAISGSVIAVNRIKPQASGLPGGRASGEEKA